MTREEARQIIAIWLVSSKGTKGQRGYIEGWFDEEDVEAFRMAIEALEQEPKQGKWVREEHKDYKCSICGVEQWDNTDFCPNCRAKMDGERSE